MVARLNGGHGAEGAGQHQIARDGAVAKFHRRAARMPVAVAMILTLLECVLTLLLVRFVYRMLKKGVLFLMGRRTPKSVSLQK